MPFKSGIYHLAEQFPQVQLIPTWIDNVQRVMPKGEVVPVPILCTVTFRRALQLQPGESKADFCCAREAVMEQRPDSAAVPSGGGRLMVAWLKQLSSSEQVALLFVVLFGFLMLLTAGSS
jgi:hypothetical protein